MFNKDFESIDFISYRDQSLKLEDGIELVSRIWFPNNPGPWPALLMRQPYGREIASSITYPHPSWWASHGYLVIIQDVRGQGDSQGEFKGFSQESSDTSQTHQWARSLKECNGKLGTYGFSYQGFTQLVALEGSTPPDCSAPAMTGLNEKDHWSCEGNAYWWHLGLAWGLQLAALQAKRTNKIRAWQRIRGSLENGSYLIEGKELLKEHDPKGMAYQWLMKSNKQEESFTEHKPLTSWLKQPMLLIGGWWDPHLTGIIDIYKQSLSAGGKPEIHIGPASHLKWWNEAYDIQLNFFNLHLKGLKSTNKPRERKNLWNISTEEWISEKYKHNKEFIYWGLSSNGSACFAEQEGGLKRDKEGQGWLELVHDPWRPVPSIGGHLSQNPGYKDRNDIDNRLDVATFTTNQVDNDLYIEGIPLLELFAHSDQKGFDLCVALSIVSKDKLKAKQISTGFLRIRGKEALHKVKRKVLLQPICASLKPSEHLRLSISGSCWPAIAINPGSEEIDCGPPGAKSLVTTIKISLNQSKLQISPLLDE